MYGHLIAVEVGVKCRADQRMNLDRLAFHQHRLEGLNSQAMESRSAVQQYRMVFDDLFQHVPDDGVLHLHQFLGLLDGRAMADLLQTVIDEWFEQFERHLLRQTALMQLQFWTDDDDGTARIVDALAEKVLAEPA